MAMTRLFLTLLVVFVLTAAPCLAAEADPGVIAELDQMLKSYSQAFKDKDVDAVMGLFAPDAVLMGTGPGERYDGTEEIRAAHLQFFGSYDKLTTERTWFKIWVKGDAAWAMTMAHHTTYNKNVKNEFALNTSVVFEKRNGKWVFVSQHFSNLVRD